MRAMTLEDEGLNLRRQRLDMTQIELIALLEKTERELTASERTLQRAEADIRRMEEQLTEYEQKEADSYNPAVDWSDYLGCVFEQMAIMADNLPSEEAVKTVAFVLDAMTLAFRRSSLTVKDMHAASSGHFRGHLQELKQAGGYMQGDHEPFNMLAIKMGER